jgi:hypothetical protein
MISPGSLVDISAHIAENVDLTIIDLCLANEPRPTNGRPENQAKTTEPRIVYKANTKKPVYSA